MIEVDPEPLLLKGVKRIYYIKYPSNTMVSGIRDAWKIASETAYRISQRLGIEKYRVEFIDNEPIGTKYIVYRYRLYTGERWVASIRIVSLNRALHMVVVTSSV